MVLMFTEGSAQSHSFSYATPVCRASGFLLPTLSPGFPIGNGFFSSTPGGLLANPSNGMINTNANPNLYTVTFFSGTLIVSTTVQVVPSPTVSIKAFTVCTGGESTFTLEALATAGVSYTWQPSGATTATNAVPVSQLPAGNTVVVENSFGCKAQASVSAIPKTPFIAIQGPTTTCFGNSVTLFAPGGSSYNWSTGHTTGAITVAPPISTVYTLNAIDNNGCKASATATLTVTPAPALTVNDVTVCSGGSGTIMASGAAPNATYSWGAPLFSSGPSVTVSPAFTTVYSVSMTSGGCVVTRTVAAHVVGTTTPNTLFYYNGPICTDSGDPIPMFDPGFEHGGYYESDLPVDSLTGQITVNASPAGTYIVNYSLSAKGCTLGALSTAIVEVNQAIPANFPSVITITEGDKVSLSIPNAQGLTWSPGDWLSCTACDIPVASPPVTTSYCAVGNINGCWKYVCTKVEVVCYNPGDLSVPNAFTPNKDGKNEKFCLKGWSKCLKEFSVHIFNRWGEEVFASSDPNFCWDGVYNGEVLAGDVYIYAIKATFNEDPPVVKNGSITLIR
jgi:gliding motility-associated-like protein